MEKSNVNIGTESINKKITNEKLQVLHSNVKFIVDGKTLILTESTRPFLYKNRLYAPLRFIAESMSVSISWDTKFKRVDMKSNGGTGGTGGTGGAGGTGGSGGSGNTGGTGGTGGSGGSGNTGGAGGTGGSGESGNTGGTGGTGGSGGSGNTGGTGGTGGTTIPTNPTDVQYTKIISSTESKLSSLQSRCSKNLTNLYNLYKSTTNQEMQKKYIEQGITELNTCDERFNLILGSLTGQLLNTGRYPEAEVIKYRKQYEEIKQKNMDKLLGG
jgi:hypothetical protein